MAYDIPLGERIAGNLRLRGVSFEEKKMFGGLCFMVDNKMCIGILKDELMCRIDPESEGQLLEIDGSRKMDFTGRPMKGYLNVEPEAIASGENLDFG